MHPAQVRATAGWLQTTACVHFSGVACMQNWQYQDAADNSECQSWRHTGSSNVHDVTCNKFQRRTHSWLGASIWLAVAADRLAAFLGA